MRIHKEGYPTLMGVAIGILLALLLTWFYLSTTVWVIFFLLLLGFYLFFLNFFRNPDRSLSEVSTNQIYCPADGKIVVIEKTKETEFFNEDRIQVSIFMSPLNVHVNRNPVSGEIMYYKYHPGAFYKAWEPKASTDNERTTIVYQSAKGQLLMRQIAGALARRIVCYLDKGSQVVQGEDMGFIKLGSRVDVFLPLEVSIKVEIGQMVQGNVDVLAEW